MDCDYLMDLPFKESYKLNAYDLKNKKASKTPLFKDGEGYQFEYIHKQ